MSWNIQYVISGWKKSQVVILVKFSIINYCHKFESMLELVIPLIDKFYSKLFAGITKYHTLWRHEELCKRETHDEVQQEKYFDEDEEGISS